MKVCLGGTFNVIHAGHSSLIRRAFELGDLVYIGLTSDRMALEMREEAKSYQERRRSLARYAGRFRKKFVIVKLEDPYGPSTEVEDMDAIVVSEGTAFRAEEINEMRERKGMKRLQIEIVPMVRSVNGVPISSSRVLAGDCDLNGRMQRRLRVGIGTTNAAKVSGIRKAFSLFTEYFGTPIFVPMESESGVPLQPFNYDTVRGASRRARYALEGNDMGVGVEAGLFEQKRLGMTFDVQYCVIIDRAGRRTVGHGMGFTHPDQVLLDVKTGMTVGASIGQLSGLKNVGRRGGAVGFLTHGRIRRSELTSQAVISALIPRINEELYIRQLSPPSRS